MNEIPPPPDSDPIPPELRNRSFPPPPLQPTPGVRAAVKAGQAGLGSALLVISCAGGVVFHALPVLGLMAAMASLFFDGYRYIFVGYILTALIILGLGFLVLITVCGHMNIH